MAYSQEIARSLLSGPLADRPLASVGRYWYFADDEDGGTLYKSDGSTWRQVSGAVAGGGSPTGSAGGVLDGSYPNPGLAAGVAGAGLAETSDVLSVNVDGSTLEINSDALRVKALGITDAHVALANKDGTTSTPSMRTLGTGASQAAAGNDSRLSDSRTPSGSAGGVLDGTYPNPGLAAGVAGAGLAETSDVLSVNVDGSTIEINADSLRVKASGITANEIAADAVGSSELADNAVDTNAIQANAVTAAKVAADVATQAELDAHTGDTSDAHAASAISADSTTLVGTGTDVQAVLEELDNGIADHLADTSAAHAGSAISFSPSGFNAATDVQAAIVEAQLSGRYGSSRGVALVSGLVAEGSDRTEAILNNAILASGRVQSQAVPVLAGDVIAAITFWQGATGFTAATNSWFALVDSSLNVIRQSTDQLTTGITANTVKTLTVDSLPVTAGSRSGTSTVTLTFPTLSQALTSLIAAGDSIVVSNANIAAYNGTFTVVTVSSTQITYVAGGAATDSLAAPFPTVQLAAGKRTYTVPTDGYVYACIMLTGTVGTHYGAASQASNSIVPILNSRGQTGLTGTCPSPVTATASSLQMWAGLT